MNITRLTIFGFFAGFLLGMGDYFLMRLVDVTMVVDGKDATLFVVTMFALNFGALGAVIARLWEQRQSLALRAVELRRMQATLVEHETLAAVGRMSAGVAHEVRNPLSVIRSSAQFLATDLEGEDADAARFICEEVDRLDDFVGRILDFSRGIEVQTAPVPWPRLLERLQTTLGPGTEIEGDDGTYEIDTELTVRLIANLVDNARKADAQHVRVRAATDAIEVLDDGTGVPDEHRESVFEPFFTTRAQGTGLGLAMARKLARVQGWDLVLGDGGLGPAGRGANFRLVRGDAA